ncbi:MAG: hypothetical protein KGJ78_04610 [Alphaproteobacteria bacterium]|nr:hypothetical protein [Alphaproteobacteria bacterium]
MRNVRLHVCAAALAVVAGPAFAADLGDWSISPWTTALSGLNLTVGGRAEGSLFDTSMPKQAGFEQQWASGLADISAKLERDYDSGLTLSLKSSFEVARDKLSYDNYGGRLVQKVYGLAQTGLGRVEIGMTDGAAYALSVTGPVVDDATSMDNANATFFLDPTTGRDFTRVFALNSAVESSLNYAKISYYTPRLFGLQLAASYTPSEGRDVVPFLNNGPNLSNRQKSIWEGAASYSNYFGPVSVGLYGGFSFAHAERKTLGHAGLTEWGFGSEIDYNVNDDVKVAVGGAYRHTNTYAFDIYDALAAGGTDSTHLSTTITDGPWIAGAEFGTGTADGGTVAPTIGVHGYQASVGYVFNANLQATVGWQDLKYNRNSGLFYNGASRIDMNAAFVHLKLHV